MNGDFLTGMAASSRARSAAAQAQSPERELRARIADLPPTAALRLSSFDLIAEVKLRSPAVGLLKQSAGEDVGARVGTYAHAGAAAVSILTEPSRFDGSLADLAAGARALAPLRVPAMRKDFLVDPYQVIEARLAGAGGILVIARMLDRSELEALVAAAVQLQLFVLVETFDERDIEAAAQLQASATARDARLLIGVNSRDLVTLKVVPGRLEELVTLLPTHLPRVAESGVGSPEDAARLAACGYELALIGSALMTSDNPQGLLSSMISAGRGARAR